MKHWFVLLWSNVWILQWLRHYRRLNYNNNNNIPWNLLKKITDIQDTIHQVMLPQLFNWRSLKAAEDIRRWLLWIICTRATFYNQSPLEDHFRWSLNVTQNNIKLQRNMRKKSWAIMFLLFSRCQRQKFAQTRKWLRLKWRERRKLMKDQSGFFEIK